MLSLCVVMAVTASGVHLAPLWQVEEGLRDAGDVAELTGHQRVRVPGGDDGGELVRVDAVEVAPSPLPPTRSDLAEQALDPLDELEEHGLAEQDVDPGVEDGVEGGEAYRSEVRVPVQPQHPGGFVQLVQEDLYLEGSSE